jgi:hypothetical protein
MLGPRIYGTCKETVSYPITMRPLYGSGRCLEI